MVCFQSLLSTATCATTLRAAKLAERATADVANKVGRCRFTARFDPGLTPRGFQRLNRKYDDPLSNFAFNCNLRHYKKVVYERKEISEEITKVGQCRLTPGFLQLTPRLLPTLETTT